MRQTKPQDIFSLSKYNKYLLVAVFIARFSSIYIVHTYIMAFLSAIVDDITDAVVIVVAAHCQLGKWVEGTANGKLQVPALLCSALHL